MKWRPLKVNSFYLYHFFLNLTLLLLLKCRGPILGIGNGTKEILKSEKTEGLLQLVASEMEGQLIVFATIKIADCRLDF